MHIITVDLDERGRLSSPGGRHAVPGHRIAEHHAEHVRTPGRVTDLYVYVHGWQTAPAAVDGGEGARKHPPVVVERAPRRDRVDRLVDKDW